MSFSMLLIRRINARGSLTCSIYRPKPLIVMPCLVDHFSSRFDLAARSVFLFRTAKELSCPHWGSEPHFGRVHGTIEILENELAARVQLQLLVCRRGEA